MNRMKKEEVPADVNVKYRKNLDAYNQWEEAERKRQDAAILAFQRRERKGFKVPHWVAVLAGLVNSRYIPN